MAWPLWKEISYYLLDIYMHVSHNPKTAHFISVLEENSHISCAKMEMIEFFFFFLHLKKNWKELR